MESFRHAHCHRNIILQYVKNKADWWVSVAHCNREADALQYIFAHISALMVCTDTITRLVYCSCGRLLSLCDLWLV